MNCTIGEPLHKRLDVYQNLVAGVLSNAQCMHVLLHRVLCMSCITLTAVLGPT